MGPAGERGDTGGRGDDVAVAHWGGRCRASSVSSAPREACGRAATAAWAGQWTAAARRHGSPASRRGEGAVEVRGVLPRVADGWDPGCVGPVEWVSGAGRF